MLIRTKKRILTYNGLGLGEEADLEALTFSLSQMPIESTNVEFSTNADKCHSEMAYFK